MKKCGLRMAQGGIVRGKGGPTDDMVPMRVGGKNVNLSNTEAVLPARTVQALGGPKAVEALIEQTNGKPPVRGGLREGGSYYTGAAGDTIDPRELRPEFRSQPEYQKVGPQWSPKNPNVAKGTASPEAAAYSNPAPKATAPAAADTPDAPKAKPSWSSRAGKVMGLGNAAGGVYDMVAADSNSERMVGGLKTLSAAPHPVAKAVGYGATLADMAAQGLTGKSIGKHLDTWFNPDSDRTIDAVTQAAPTVKQAQAAQAQTAATTPAATTPAVTTPAAPTLTESAKNLAKQNQVETALQDPRGLGRNLTFMGNKDATEYSIANDARGGVITRQPGADGLRKTTYLSGAPTGADAARDAEFAAKGYGKDAYGNWMTPQRMADAAKLEGLQRAAPTGGVAILGGSGMGDERQALLKKAMTAHPGSQNGQLTAAQMANARGILSDHQQEQLRAQELANSRIRAQQEADWREKTVSNAQAKGLGAKPTDDFKNQLDLAKFWQEERKMSNLQGNNERDHQYKVEDKHRSRIDDILRASAGDDPKRFAQLKAYEANFAQREGVPKPGTEEYYKALSDNLLIDDAFAADEGGWFRSVGKTGTDPVQGLRRDSGLFGSYLVDPHSGRRVSESELAKLSPSARRILMEERLDPNYR